MTLIKITGVCDKCPCPTVYRTDRGTLAVQGDALAGVPVPEGEQIVEIPESLLRDAARALGWTAP